MSSKNCYHLVLLDAWSVEKNQRIQICCIGTFPHLCLNCCFVCSQNVLKKVVYYLSSGLFGHVATGSRAFVTMLSSVPLLETSGSWTGDCKLAILEQSSLPLITLCTCPSTLTRSGLTGISLRPVSLCQVTGNMRSHGCGFLAGDALSA